MRSKASIGQHREKGLAAKVGRPKAELARIKFGTTLPDGLPARVAEYAESEGMTMSDIHTQALELWMEMMDGRGHFRPINQALLKRVDARLNQPKFRKAIEALLELTGAG